MIKHSAKAIITYNGKIFILKPSPVFCTFTRLIYSFINNFTQFINRSVYQIHNFAVLLPLNYFRLPYHCQ